MSLVDLARMLQFSDRVAVFFAARLAEMGPSDEVRRAPRHPCTQGLIRAFPSLRRTEAPVSIPRVPPSLETPPPGCRFHPRCPRAEAVCAESVPPFVRVGPGYTAACFFAE